MTACPTTGAAGVTVPIVIACVAFTTTVVEPNVAAAVEPDPLTKPADAVTFAVRDVVNVACALPLASVATTVGDTLPASVENETGTPPSALPPGSATVAITVAFPPVDGSVPGLATNVTLATAAVPIAIFTVSLPDVAAAPAAPAAPADVGVAPPDVAMMVAVPYVVPALNFTVTRPPNVSACAG